VSKESSSRVLFRPDLIRRSDEIVGDGGPPQLGHGLQISDDDTQKDSYSSASIVMTSSQSVHWNVRSSGKPPSFGTMRARRIVPPHRGQARGSSNWCFNDIKALIEARRRSLARPCLLLVRGADKWSESFILSDRPRENQLTH
jgi:hypothetical protein